MISILLGTLLQTGALAAAPPCTLATAVPADVREMALEPERWFDRCVRLEGYLIANRFFTDIEARYHFEANDRTARSNGGWLGVYFAQEGPFNRQLRRGTLVGVVQDCGRSYEAMSAQAEPGSIIMMLGYCHYRRGLNVQQAQFHSRGDATFERQIGAAARTRFGDLEPASAEIQPPPEAVALMERFLAAVRAGDGAGLLRFVGLWSESPDPDGDPNWNARLEAYLLGRGGSPLAFLAGGGEPQRAWFRERLHRESAEESLTGDWFVCFCKSSDCEGRWPISHFDASAAPQRPYACLRAFRDANGDGPPDMLAIERRDFGLVEPASPTR